MSILNVEHLTHGFGDRAIFEDVSFRLLKGEHIGLVGANGEGKSTFMSIVTGKLMPDEGKVEWAKNVHAGYLDQHAVLEKGMTIGQVLKSAFDPLLKKEERMNEICDKLEKAAFADYFVICSGNSERQITTLADEMEDRLAEEGLPVKSIEGRHGSGWILMDFGDIIVNLFTREMRERYSIEKVWGDCQFIEVEESIISLAIIP